MDAHIDKRIANQQFLSLLKRNPRSSAVQHFFFYYYIKDAELPTREQVPASLLALNPRPWTE